MDVTLETLGSQHLPAVLEILNFYIANSMAAFAEEALTKDACKALLAMVGDYPSLAARRPNDEIIGFCFLRPYHRLPTFGRSAEVVNFILPGHTSRGLGAAMLAELERRARARGIDCILAAISGHNPGSQRFHLAHGFCECGRFRRVGRKHGQDFDVVWMQKLLD